MEKYKGIEVADWKENEINKFWDFVSKQPEKYFTNHVGSELVKYFSSLINKNDVILDYGAGVGFLSELLLENGFSVKCLDSSYDSIQLLNNKLKKHKNFLGAIDLKGCKKSNEKYDVIFVIEVIEHLDDVFLNEMLENIASLLNKNGKVIFTTPNNEKLEDSYIYTPFSDVVFHRWQHVRSWTSKSLKDKLIGAGFSSVETRETHFLMSPKWKGFNRKTLGLYLEFLKHKVEKKKPHLVAIALID